MKKCPKCGTNNSGNAEFCNLCGERFDVNKAERPEPEVGNARKTSNQEVHVVSSVQRKVVAVAVGGLGIPIWTYFYYLSGLVRWAVFTALLCYGGWAGLSLLAGWVARKRGWLYAGLGAGLGLLLTICVDVSYSSGQVIGLPLEDSREAISDALQLVILSALFGVFLGWLGEIIYKAFSNPPAEKI